MPTVDNWRALVERLQTEADLCRNDGAEDIAALLDEAAIGLQGMAAEVQALREDAVAVKIRDRMVMCYQLRPVDVATACDDMIDHSGNLLGWVRNAARTKGDA